MPNPQSGTPIKNPFFERGLFLSEEEYNLASSALTMLGEKFDKENHPDYKAKCVKLIVRLHHIMHAGEGVTKEATERYANRIAKAMENRNPDGISRGIADLIAATVRMDPDPAEKIGILLSNMIRSGIAETSKTLILAWLTDLSKLLGDGAEGWDEGTPKDALTWASEVVNTGIANIKDGLDPWTFASETDSGATAQ